MTATTEAPQTGTKECEGCLKWKPLSAFWRHVDSPDGRQVMCKQCHIERGTGSRERRGRVHSGPPRPRRSPYDNMRDVLRDIEKSVETGDLESIRAKIAAARQKYMLA